MSKHHTVDLKHIRFESHENRRPREARAEKIHLQLWENWNLLPWKSKRKHGLLLKSSWLLRRVLKSQRPQMEDWKVVALVFLNHSCSYWKDTVLFDKLITMDISPSRQCFPWNWNSVIDSCAIKGWKADVCNKCPNISIRLSTNRLTLRD